MKKQNLNNKMAFNKAAVTELNGTQIVQIKGGSGTKGNDSDNSFSSRVCDPFLDKMTVLEA